MHTVNIFGHSACSASVTLLNGVSMSTKQTHKNVAVHACTLGFGLLGCQVASRPNHQFQDRECATPKGGAAIHHGSATNGCVSVNYAVRWRTVCLPLFSVHLPVPDSDGKSLKSKFLGYRQCSLS